jgi:hypothetical protein
MLACRFVGAGGMPSRLLQPIRKRFAPVATAVTAGFLKRVEFDLRESSDPHDRSQRKRRKHDEKPAAFHPLRAPVRKAVGNAKERWTKRSARSDGLTRPL